ncbi:diaminopimelate epimerase [Nonlabens ulvanivorans]|uniref:Diaminopimelate epimerase n=1 Tax=Nonlabens ulvanivorans TaxID=906888 RepID=A0A090R0F1_NONUL|nr:diaminopimelate epimerase [Nonlabens ulvanivorans]GAL01177.1 diaminopimelate epimerase [Nonlabens ulvanivorans]
MSHIQFYKYQGTGNDFVMIDNRDQLFSKNDTKFIELLCDRKFGIGADGLILLENHPTADFKMVYFNADGQESTMCGNGGRCLVRFAQFLEIIKDTTTFEAIDGLHHARVVDDISISLQMSDVTDMRLENSYVFTDTGSPHHVQLTENLTELDVYKEGKYLRDNVYGKAGANINFVQLQDNNTFKVRTYERGVEDETLSCGTGVTAVAIAMHKTNHTASNEVTLETPGGVLKVSFEACDTGYENIWLTGPALQVFKGTFTA